MEITKVVNGKDLLVSINGRLDTSTATNFDEYISQNLAEIENLTLDCKGLEYISSAGLRVLLNTQKKMQQIGSFKLKNVCELVMEVFEMTGFANILNIE